MAPKILPKDLAYKSKILELAGDPSRIQILKLLIKNNPLNVSEITAALALNLPCVSHHLQLLKDNKLVLARRRGNQIFYRLAPNPFVKRLLQLIG